MAWLGEYHPDAHAAVQYLWHQMAWGWSDDDAIAAGILDRSRADGSLLLARIMQEQRSIKTLAAEPRGTGAKPRRCRLRIHKQTVLLDGERVPLNLTAEATEDVLTFLQALMRRPGEWVSGPEIEPGRRWDLVRKKLPPKLLALTETDRRKGNRLTEDALRK
jgi:hypothetical protein